MPLRGDWTRESLQQIAQQGNIYFLVLAIFAQGQLQNERFIL